MGGIEGFILVGGRSSRMGTDKSMLALEGRTFVDRLNSALSTTTTLVSLVGKKPDGRGSDLPNIPDVHEGWGALGGVHAALSAASAEWVAVVACDLPFVTPELFTRLASFREAFEAVAPIQSDGIPQPLCALYRVRPCRKRAEELIESGERRPVALLQSVRTRWTTFRELADLKGAEHFFDNINTPQDYSHATKKGVDIKDAGI